MSEEGEGGGRRRGREGQCLPSRHAQREEATAMQAYNYYCYCYYYYYYYYFLLLLTREGQADSGLDLTGREGGGFLV